MGILKWTIGIALFTAHLKAYKMYYANIVMSFSLTFMLKKLIKTIDKDKSELFGLGGYAVTILTVLKLFTAMYSNGTGVKMDDLKIDEEILKSIQEMSK